MLSPLHLLPEAAGKVTAITSSDVANSKCSHWLKHLVIEVGGGTPAETGMDNPMLGSMIVKG